MRALVAGFAVHPVSLRKNEVTSSYSEIILFSSALFDLELS